MLSFAKKRGNRRNEDLCKTVIYNFNQHWKWMQLILTVDETTAGLYCKQLLRQLLSGTYQHNNCEGHIQKIYYDTHKTINVQVLFSSKVSVWQATAILCKTNFSKLPISSTWRLGQSFLCDILRNSKALKYLSKPFTLFSSPLLYKSAAYYRI